MATQWFYHTGDGKEKGPLTSAEVRKEVEAGRVTPETPVRRDVDTQFVKARCIRNLFAAAPEKTASVPKPQTQKIPAPVPQAPDQTSSSVDFSQGVLEVEKDIPPSRGTHRLERPIEGEWDEIGSDPSILEGDFSDKPLVSTEKPLFQEDAPESVSKKPKTTITKSPPVFIEAPLSPVLPPESFRPTTRRVRRKMDPVFTDTRIVSYLSLLVSGPLWQQFFPVVGQLVRAWLVSVGVTFIAGIMMLLGGRSTGGFITILVCACVFSLCYFPGLILRRPMAICQALCERERLEDIVPWSVWLAGKPVFALYLLGIPFVVLAVYAQWDGFWILAILNVYVLFVAPMWLLSFAASQGRLNFATFVSCLRAIPTYFPIACIFECIILIAIGLFFAGTFALIMISRAVDSGDLVKLITNLLVAFWMAFCFAVPLIYMAMALGKLHVHHNDQNQAPPSKNTSIVRTVCGILLGIQILLGSWMTVSLFRGATHQLFPHRKGTTEQKEAEHDTKNEDENLGGSTAGSGSTSDDGSDFVVRSDHDTPEFKAASAKARLQLPGLRQRFAKGLDPEEHIGVKCPFKTDDGRTEWMWIKITSWTGTTIKGILTNEPVWVQGLKCGSELTVKEDEVIDYFWEKADGSYEGNETGKILEKKQ